MAPNKPGCGSLLSMSLSQDGHSLQATRAWSTGMPPESAMLTITMQISGYEKGVLQPHAHNDHM